VANAARATGVHSLFKRQSDNNQPHHNHPCHNGRDTFNTTRPVPRTDAPRDPRNAMVRRHARHSIPIVIPTIVTRAIVTTTTTKIASRPCARDGSHRRAQ